MKYLIIDASLNGTGIRDKYEGGYLAAEDLELSAATLRRLNEWLAKYEAEHYNGFIDQKNIDELDTEGRIIATLVKNELSEVKMEYFSHARLTTEMI